MNKIIKAILIVFALLLFAACVVTISGNSFLHYEAKRKIKLLESDIDKQYEELNEIRKQITFFEEAQDMSKLYF